MNRVIEAILFAAGEPVETERLSKSLECDPDEIDTAARALMDRLAFERRGIRIVHLGKLLSDVFLGRDGGVYYQNARDAKTPKLSASQLETLTVIAYYQPATKAYVEQIRGVDSSYSVSALLNKQLIEECGRLNVPGRPILYRTTADLFKDIRA